MSHAIRSLYFVIIRSDWPSLMSKFELRVGRYFDSLVKLLIWRERKSDRFILEEKNMGEKATAFLLTYLVRNSTSYLNCPLLLHWSN